MHSPSPPPGDDKLPPPVESTHDVGQPSRAIATPDEDYPVERVEAVYRKLDLRIIPGLPPIPPERHAPRPIASAR